MHLLITVVALGIASGTAAFTVSKTKITEPLRRWIASKNRWLGDLLGCPYCLSHWFAAAAVLIYRPRFLDLNPVLDLGVTWLVTVFIAAVTFGVVVRQIFALTPLLAAPRTTENGPLRARDGIPVPPFMPGGTTGPNR